MCGLWSVECCYGSNEDDIFHSDMPSLILLTNYTENTNCIYQNIKTECVVPCRSGRYGGPPGPRSARPAPPPRRRAPWRRWPGDWPSSASACPPATPATSPAPCASPPDPGPAAPPRPGPGRWWTARQEGQEPPNIIRSGDSSIISCSKQLSKPRYPSATQSAIYKRI